MDFETKAFSWFGNLRDQFNTLCSEADEIIPQEPIRYVQNQLLTAGENLKQFCTEFVGDVLPTFITHSLEKEGLVAPKQRENAGLPARKTSNDMIADDDQEMTSDAANSPSSSSLSDELMDEKCVDNPFKGSMKKIEKNESNAYANSSACSAQYSVSLEEVYRSVDLKFIAKFQEYLLPDNDASSSASGWSTEAIQSNDSIGTGCDDATVEILEPEIVETLSDTNLLSHDVGGEATNFPTIGLGKASTQLIAVENLEEILTLLNSDEFCSDSDIKENQEINITSIEKKKFARQTQGVINSEIDQESLDSLKQQEQDEEESILSDEDDWEII